MVKNKKCAKLNKKISITLSLCMLFQIIQGSFLLTEKAFAATGFRHVTSGDDVILGGNYIEVGVSKAGSFGTAGTAPSGFHPTDGGVGLRVDGDGFDTGNAPTTGDFFLPGTPEESFTVGYKAGSVTAGPTNYTNAERVGQTAISTVTTDTTSGDTLSATTAGTTSDNNLVIQQKITFKVNDKFFKNTVTYTNKGTSALYDVRYMRSFDPDQDADLHGSFQTYNSVLENFPQDKRSIVRATGAVTRESVFFISTDSRARASTFGFTNRDPYSTSAYNADGSLLKKPEQLVDQAIAITFALGDLAPGQSTTFEYYTSLDPNYNAGLAAIMGSLGIQINNGAATTNSTNVTLNLNGTNVSQMRFSNDNSNWSDWESYAATKAWTLTPGNGDKTVYAQFKDASGNVSNASASINYNNPDTTAPTFSVSGNPTTWTNGSVTLTVTASDADSGLNTSGAYSFDNGATWTTSNSKTFSANGIVNIKVKDNSGNVASQSITIGKVDSTAPTVSVSGNPTSWTKGDVILTVAASDDQSGLDSTGAYSFDGGKTWTTSNSMTFSSNQTVNLCVRDSLGNATSKSVTIDKIDKAAPNYTSITQSPVPSQWTNGSVKLTVNGATDNAGSGLDTAAYSFSTTEGVYNWQTSNVSSDFSVNQTVYVYVKDAIGNISSGAKVDISNIDITSPNVPVINNADNYTSAKYYISTQTISAGFTATSGSNEILQYSLNNGTWTNGSSVNVSAEGINTVKFRVIDETGRTSGEAGCVVQIDTTSPTISSVSGNPTSWTGNSVTLTVNAADTLSGLDSNAYSFDGGKTWQSGNNKTYDTNTNGIVIKVRDKEGNVASYDAIDITKIDKTTPQAAVIDNAASYVDSKWYNTDQVITAGFAATEGCAEKLQYKVNDGGWTDGTSVPITTEGKYSVSFRVIDELGRVGLVQNVQMNLDKTAPTDLTVSLKGNSFKKFLNKITFGIFSKDNVDVNITADGNISGIKDMEYQLVDTSKDETFDAVNGKWVKYSSLTISPQFKGTVYARAVDNAGNVSEIVNSDGVVVDSVQPTAPVITAIADGSSYNGLWTSKNVVLNTSGANALSGIDHYEYKFGASGAWTTMPEQTGAVDATSAKAINDKMTVTEPIAGTYYFRAISSSGIAGAETSKVIRHENTAPVTKVDFTGTVDAWTKGPVKFNVSNANEDILCPVTSWIKIGDNNWTKLGIDGYTFDNEINVPVRFKTVTDAGLENIDPRTYNVKIDRTVPVISGADSGKNYYVGRVITTGDNSNDSYNAVYKINGGSEVNLPSGTLLSGAGEYAVTVTDQAGNASSVNFTVKKIPAASEVLYTPEWHILINSIRSEFDAHTDLPEPYKTNTDNEIKDLENMYKKLDDEVNTTKQEVSDIKSTVDKLPAANDGLIAMEDNIQKEYDKIAGDSSTLTAEQKSVLQNEKNYLSELLDTIKGLKDKNNDINSRASAIPTIDDGLISQKDSVKKLLDEIAGLTNEQKAILKPTVDALNALLTRISSLQDNVNAEGAKADAIPTSDDGLIAQKDAIEKTLDEISKMTSEQKQLLKDRIEELNGLLTKANALQAVVDNFKVNANDALNDKSLVSQRNKIKNLLDQVSKLTSEQKALLKNEIDRLLAALQSDNEMLKDLDAAVDKLSIIYASGDNAANVTKAMYLVTSGINGTSITWSSSDTGKVTNTGRVTRPDPEAEDLPITLTAAVKDPKTNEVITKQFNIVVKKLSEQEAANEAAKLLTAEQAFSFDSAGDTWESVTNRFLLLNKGAYKTTIAWESNKPEVISINSSDGNITGNVVRPADNDQDVILTARVAKGNATAIKTFLIVVKQSGVVKQASAVRVDTKTNASITSGSSEEPVNVNIKRTTLDNSAGIIDTLIVTDEAMAKLTDNIDPTADSSTRRVVINMPQPTDGTSNADVQAVEIPAIAVQGLAEKNASLEVQMDTVKIKLDANEIKAINDKGTDLYFKVVPIKDNSEQSKLSTNAKANTAVIDIAKSLGNGVAVPQGVPYTIETNYSGINTKLVIPFTNITIPTENRMEFLDSLRVYIEHSDGTKEAKGGTIVYDEKGNPIGIEISIDRFSSFQIFSVAHPKTEGVMPKTGSLIDAESIIILGIVMVISGLCFLKIRRKNN